MQQKHSQGALKKVTIIGLIVLVVVGLGLGYYFNEKLSDLEEQNALLVNQTNQTSVSNGNGSGSSEISLSQPGDTTQERSATRTRSSNPDREIITGQAMQEAPGEDVLVECYVYGNLVEEVWLRYGNTLVPQSQTPREQEGLGEGEDDVYGSFVARIPATELEPGAIYTYRCHGTAGGETVQGGIASFTSRQQQQ